jgi:hypothetical protein
MWSEDSECPISLAWKGIDIGLSALQDTIHWITVMSYGLLQMMILSENKGKAVVDCLIWD